jgi:O-antigen/teichoic acid export membrane protein
MEKFKITCIESMRYFFSGIVPITVGTILLGDRIISLIYSSEFLPAAKVLSILIFLLILFSQNQIFANSLIAAGHQRINFMANLIGMIISIVLNIYLITKMGFVGAGIAGVSAALVTCIYQYWHFRKHLFRINFFALLLKPTIAGAVMGVFVYYTRNANLIMVIAAAGVIYLAALSITKGISLKQFLTFKQAIEVYK